MKSLSGMQAGIIASTLVLALLLNPFVYAAAQESASPATDPQSQNGGSTLPPRPSAVPSNPTATTNDELPDSPGSLPAQPEQAAPAQPAQAQAQSPTPAQSQNPREPVGTAAAKTVPTTGIAASRPAGSALAPAKQRRIRSILIRTGALVGAAAAIGATMALSMGSPSRPPGAR